jgi:hypothetical protein
MFFYFSVHMKYFGVLLQMYKGGTGIWGMRDTRFYGILIIL